MAIDSDDHGDYIVTYEVGKNNVCPVCELISEHEAEITALLTKMVTLKDEVKDAEDHIESSQHI